MMHPQKDQLIAFGQGKLAPDDSLQVERHLEACDACCETLLNLQDDTFSGLVRAAGKGDASASVADLTFGGATAEVQNVVGPAATLHLQSGTSVGAAQLPVELREHPRYHIVGLLGRGGMGDVYRAEHRLMNRPVAIKLINSQLIRHPQAVERFRREVRAAAKLSHPNIVAAYDAEQAGDAHFLVMEFVEGTDLASLVNDRGPMSVPEACRCIRHAAEGLQHAHEQGMVHRDIKPHNLMLSRTGQVRILDFGLAAFASETATSETDSTDAEGSVEHAHLTAVGSVMGTPDYIAPEQADDAHGADIRADIYSMGCTLWFLLTGKPPFQADSVPAKLLAHAEQPPPSLATACKAAPADLANIVRRMMAKKPAERFQTPAEVAAALTPFTQVAPPRRRKRGRLIAATALFAALIFAGIIVRVVTDEGEFIVDVGDESVAVLVEMNGLKIRDKSTGREYRLKPGKNPVRSGEYLIDVSELPAGLQLSTYEFRLNRGEEQRVAVSFKPAAAPKAGPPIGPAENLSAWIKTTLGSASTVAPPAASSTQPPKPAIAATTSTPVGVNLLNDSSFEATMPGGLPPGWSPWLDDGPKSRCEVVAGGRNDKHCLQITAEGVRAVVFANSLPLDRSKRYALKGWAKFEGPADSRAIIKFNYFHNGKFLGVHDLVGVNSKRTDWQLLEKTDIADSYPEASLLVATCTVEGSGKAWFDDLEAVAYDRDKLMPNFELVQGRNNRPASEVDLDLWAGRWKFDGEFKPTVNDPGRKVTGVTHARKILNDKFLLSYSKSDTGDTEFITMLTYDVNFGAYRLWVFGNRGEAYERSGSWNVADRKLSLELKPPAPGVTGSSTDQFIGDDRLESTLLVKSANGNVTRDMHTVLRRVEGPVDDRIPVAAGPAADPPELSLLNKFVGEWTVHHVEKPSLWMPGGDEGFGTEQAEWVLGGRFILLRGFDEKNELTTILLATYEPEEKSSRFWFFGATGSSGQWRVTWDAASRGFHWRSIDMPAGWIGSGFNRWVDDDTFDNELLIKDENGRVLVDGSHKKRRTKKN